MGQAETAETTVIERVAAARRRLRERTLAELTGALGLQVSVAAARRSYDLRALSSAFGILVLVSLALVAATADAMVSLVIDALREIARIRVRFGPAAAATLAVLPPISDEMLLDKRGRPLRGAPRTKRIALIERQRTELAALAAAAAVRSSARVIELPPLPVGLVDAALRTRSGALAAYRSSVRATAAVGALVPAIPLPTLPLRWVRVVAVTTTMTFVFATAIGTTGLIAQQGRIALGASTTLTIIAGEVSVSTPESLDFRAVSDGTLLRAGMTIRTSADSYAILTYFEGSTVSIEPNTTLLVEALESNPDGSSVISMQQQAGRTWHSVTKLLNQGSRYEVKTPGLTATVRGTAFEVGVERDSSGEVVSSVVTTEGAVGAAKPATAADPAPAEVIVPAGFQASAKPAEPVAAPEPAPEPERWVTVTVGAANAVVVDPLGRANGERDGKLVLQTPGAKVQKVDGKLVITLPKVPDGKLSTVITGQLTGQQVTGQQQATGPVSVVTVVSERGKGDARSEETVQLPASASAPSAVTGVEVKRSDTAQPAEVRVLAPSERQEAPAPKVIESPKRTEAPKPELLPAAPETKDDEGRGRDGGKVSGVVDVFVKATLPPLSIEDVARRAEEARKAEERAKEDAARREEQRRRENQERADAARKAEERAKEEAAKLSEERRKAEQKAREETTKADAGRRAEQSARGGGTSPEQTPAPANIVQNILKAIAPSGEDSAIKKVDEARKAEEKAKEDVAKTGDERRKAEDTTRQDELKRAEEERKQAEKRAEELRKAEEKAKQEAAKDLERVREIEAKAREQAQKLEAEKRREAEKLIEEFRKAEEKARQESAQRIEEQRKAEERAKEEAERRIAELRRDQERAREEAARADEERKRDEQRKSEERSREDRNKSNFLPTQTIDPLPGRLGSNDGSRGRGGSGR